MILRGRHIEFPHLQVLSRYQFLFIYEFKCACMSAHVSHKISGPPVYTLYSQIFPGSPISTSVTATGPRGLARHHLT